MKHRLLCVRHPTSDRMNKLNALLKKIQLVLPSVKLLTMYQVHFLRIEKELSRQDFLKLSRLLDHSIPYKAPKDSFQQCILLPKAKVSEEVRADLLNYLHHCGLTMVQSIWPAKVYHMGTETPLNEMQWLLLNNVFQDQKTEIVLGNLSQVASYMQSELAHDDKGILPEKIFSQTFDLLPYAHFNMTTDQEGHFHLKTDKGDRKFSGELTSLSVWPQALAHPLGLLGFSSVDLYLPNYYLPWESKELIQFAENKALQGLEAFLHQGYRKANANGIPIVAGYFDTNLRVDSETLTERVLMACIADKKDLSRKPHRQNLRLPPKPILETFNHITEPSTLDLSVFAIENLIEKVLQVPAVADKSFFVHRSDRTVGGLIAQDPLVGPWQVAVSDYSLVLKSFTEFGAEAIALGKHACSTNMAIGESLTNLAGSGVLALDAIQIGLWGNPEQDSTFFSSLGIQLAYCEKQENATAVAVGYVKDVRFRVTPQLWCGAKTQLLFIDLSVGYQRLGGSAIEKALQCQQKKLRAPEFEQPKTLKNFLEVIHLLCQEKKILAYHDRSEGGLFVTVAEMAFAAHCGVRLDVGALVGENNALLFNEELGAVIQVHHKDATDIQSKFNALPGVNCSPIGEILPNRRFEIKRGNEMLYQAKLEDLQRLWSKMGYVLHCHFGNPRFGKHQYDRLLDVNNPGLNVKLTFDLDTVAHPKYIVEASQPKVMILKNKHSLGQEEMAAVFDLAGFDCIESSLEKILENTAILADCKGLVICGGYSFHDILHAGNAFAACILYNEALLKCFQRFFQRRDTFTFGVGNGAQILSQLKGIIPGANHWPFYQINQSQLFESHLSMVEIQCSPSIFFKGMEGSRLIVPVAHKEGCASFEADIHQHFLQKNHLICQYFVDGRGRKTDHYPENPNGSHFGMCGFTSKDGRATALMTHPERIFRTVQCSWHPDDWEEYTPWLKCFQNAREWVG